MDATLLLKASLLLSVTLLAAQLLRNAPAVTRHGYWSVAFCAVLLMPLLGLAMPAFTVAVPAGWEPAASLLVAEPRGQILEQPRTLNESRLVWTEPPPAVAGQPDSVPRAGLALSVRTAMLSAWAIGTCLAVGALLLSLLRVRRMSSDAQDMGDPAWRAAANAIRARLGFRRPVRMLVSEQITTPMAGGVWRPTVFLPASCRAWTADRRDVVLAHEIAHLAGCDPARHLVTRLAVALYWFHPLAWMAARQAGAAREEACDATVIALGTRPSVYARVLLDLAESMQPRRRLLAALPMIQPSLLEMRLMGILTDTRPATRSLAAVPLLVVGFITLAVAAAQPEVRVNMPAVPPAPVTPAPGAIEPVSAPAHPDLTAMVPAQVVSVQAGSESACWRAGTQGSFSGSISTSEVGGRTVIYEQIGTRGADRVIQKGFGDLRLCLVAEDVGDGGRESLPSEWLDAAPRFVMEARRGGVVQQLKGERQAGGGHRISWQVGGRKRPFDSDAQHWRDRMLAVFDTTWELSALRGQVSSLRGEISSIRGEESSFRGQISSLRGEVSSMRGRISSVRGEESSLRGEISSIRGHENSLRGAISSERGAISSLNAGQYGETDAERARTSLRISRHKDQIVRLEQEIRAYDADAKVAAVERRIASLDSAGKVAAIEAEIRAFDLDGKVAGVERRIAELDVEGKIAGIERQIAALDADRRARQLEVRRDAELKQLNSAIAEIR